MAMHLPRRRTLAFGGIALSASVVCLSVTSPTPASAASIKQLMKEMASTTKSAKAAVASGDLAQAEAVLKSYASEAQAAGALETGGTAEAQDLRRRFSALAATAGSTQPAQFKVAFGAIVDQCRSCHSAYK